MARYDGSIRINTEINTSNLNSQVMRVNESLRRLEGEATRLRDRLRELETTEIPTEEYADLSNQLVRAQNRLEQLVQRQQRMQAEGRNSGAAWERINRQIEVARSEVGAVEIQMQELVDTGRAFRLGSDTDEYQRIAEQLRRVETDIEINNRRLQEMRNRQDSAADGFEEMEESAEEALGNITLGMQRVSRSVKSLLGYLGLSLGIAGLVALGKQAIKTASDFEAMESQFSQVFGELESVASKSLSKVAGQAGIMEERMKPSFTKIAAFAKTTGMDTASALELSERAMIAVADSAAFYDRTLEETTESLQSFLKGNYENDAALGLSATETTRNAAANKLYGKSFIELSEAQKQLTLLQMVEDANKLSGALGQAAREADTWTNQVGNLNQAWENLKATLGKFILPMAIQAVKAITNVINAINAMLVKLYAAVNMFQELIPGKKVATEISFETAKKPDTDMSIEYDKAAEGAENLAEANDDIAKSAGKAEKAAKGALAPFDDLSVLAKETEGDGAADSAGIADGFEMPKLLEDTEVEEVNSLSSAIDGLTERLKPLFDWFVRLKDLFVEGFFDGLGESWKERIADIEESARNIVKTLTEIFTDPSVVASAQIMIEKIAYALGQVVGSLVSIGITIAQNLIGGLDIYLEENKEFLKEKLISIFDIAGDVALLIGEAFGSIAYIFEAFRSENGQQLTANLIGVFTDAVMGTLETVGELAEDILKVFIKPFTENREEFRTALEGFLGVLSEVAGTVKEGVDDTFSKIKEVYDEHFKPFFDSVSDGISDLVGKFLEFWNEDMQPILDEWAELFDELWKEHLQPVIDNLIELFGTLADSLKSLWEELLMPVIDWVIQYVMPILAKVVDFLVKDFFKIFGVVSDVIGGIIKVIGGIITFLTGTFTGDWEKTWDGIVEIFKGIFNLIPSVVETIINSVIDMINGIISGINWASDFIGIPAIPEIPPVELPRLATGAVIRGGNPFMAILGDQPAGHTNIEAPLSTIEQAVENVMGRSGYGRENVPVTINLNYDGETFARLSISNILSELGRQGYNVDMLGVT